MPSIKVRVKVNSQKTNSGTLLARVPVAVVRKPNPTGQRLFQTRAQLNVHIKSGNRPETFVSRRPR